MLTTARWASFDFVAADGVNQVEAWIQGLPSAVRKAVRSRLENRLTLLQHVKQLDRPHVGQLHGECAGLLEIRFKVGNVQYRPLCCHGPGQRQVTLLAGAIEKNGRLIPPGICATALGRRAIIRDRRHIVEHT